MQTTADAIIDENNRLLSKPTILCTFSTIRHVTDVSHKLNNSNPAWISLNFCEFFRVDWDFTDFVSLLCHKFVICKFILPFLSLVMETNSFTRWKLHSPISNLKLKTCSPIWIFYPYMRSSPELYTLVHSYMLLWLRYLPFSLMLIQGLKEYK